MMVARTMLGVIPTGAAFQAEGGISLATGASFPPLQVRAPSFVVVAEANARLLALIKWGERLQGDPSARW